MTHVPQPRPVITVQERRGPEDFWMVWVDHSLAGSIHSQGDLDELIKSRGAAAGEVVYEGRAREQLDDEGPLPPGRRR